MWRGVRAFPVVALGVSILAVSTACADENLTHEIEANWCELTGADCAPPPPLQAPVLNQPSDTYRPPGPIYSIPPIYTPPARSADGP